MIDLCMLITHTSAHTHMHADTQAHMHTQNTKNVSFKFLVLEFDHLTVVKAKTFMSCEDICATLFSVFYERHYVSILLGRCALDRK